MSAAIRIARTSLRTPTHISDAESGDQSSRNVELRKAGGGVPRGRRVIDLHTSRMVCESSVSQKEGAVYEPDLGADGFEFPESGRTAASGAERPLRHPL